MGYRRFPGLAPAARSIALGVALTGLAAWIAALPSLAVADDGPTWRTYPYASGCYGGELCRGNGQGVTVRLAPRPVVAVRFYAHDEVGEEHAGRLRVRLDHHLLAREVEISDKGGVIELDGVGLSGRDLRLEVLGDDEVVVEDLEVLYGSS
jgi:hypothetical protein